ncbi:MAG: NAD(P)/FAD-dependent oxidoreductase [Alphaproteobacteria bacterium]
MTTPAHSSAVLETDAVIVGAGPVGLFAVFELGLLDLKCHVIDILDRPGGQCTELYPGKPIYDIPGIPVITGQELTERLLTQLKPFLPAFHFGQAANALTKREDGRWQISTNSGTTIAAPVIVIAAGAGTFVAKRPHVDKVAQYEGKSVFYAVRDREFFRGRNILIAGGGDSALDWTLNLAPIAGSLTLVHHRDGFRANPHSVKRMRGLVAKGKIAFEIAQVTRLHGKNGELAAVTLSAPGKSDWRHACDIFLPFFGLTIKLGPIAEFGLNLHENQIPVDTAKFESATPGIFAIGDINHYPGKLKLILCGFHEAALMAQAAFHICRPGEKLRFQYTTTSTSLHRKLGVA